MPSVIPGTKPGSIQRQLVSNSPVNWEGVEFLGAAGEYITMEGGKYPGVEYVLSGCGTSSAVILFISVVHIVGNDEDSGCNTRRISLEDHMK